MGAGKTAVLAEASDLLSQRKIAHGAIDLDALGLAYLPDRASSDAVMYDNLRSVVGNYAGLGVRRFLVARAIENDTQLRLCRGNIPAANTVVCRLTASIETAEHRVATRDSGMLQREYVARVAELASILDRAHLEDFEVLNEDRDVTRVALEMLIRAGWIPSDQPRASSASLALL